ncbi:DUF2934 domain-containing protein [Magnetovibrio blakemorei]|uniref:DUF2934 domain-containing protein n=1 Tax=Magnetovibrio blakemorei TaxID=28181 RepID=A0A1E5Q6C1_9PROT|nr:DUF2934 domain-containing protein [Magnetovibrio blakemorei]OEJ66216.1 hypothetical protein BEN30_12545 [Magnetovibrio blakemorei]
MPTKVQLEIEHRAYHIWLAEGCPDQRDFDHWLLVEQEILAQKATQKSQKKQAVPKRKTPSPRRAVKTA